MYVAGFLAVTVAGAIWWQTYRGEAWKFAGEMLMYYAAMNGAIYGATGGYEWGAKLPGRISAWLKRRRGQ